MEAVAKEKPSYGWDAPGIMLIMLGVGGVLLSAGVALIYVQAVPYALSVGSVAVIAGSIPFLLGLAMVQYGLAGKLRTRHAMLDFVEWRGDEHVLDVGTGGGMLLVGAAKRLTRGGQATGIDVWSAKDLSNNTAATTHRNIALEGVADRAAVQTDDATALSFPDASFDVVVSLLCLHNIEPKAKQATACQEIARALKPNGRVVIGDYVPTHDYARALSDAGLTVSKSSSAFGVAGALMWFLVADKPAS